MSPVEHPLNRTDAEAHIRRVASLADGVGFRQHCLERMSERRIDAEDIVLVLQSCVLVGRPMMRCEEWRYKVKERRGNASPDRQDIEVSFSNVGHLDGDGILPPEALYYQVIKSNNTKYKMWYQPFGNYDNGMGGPDARTAIDGYPTIGDVAGYTTRVVEGEDAADIFTVFDPAMYVTNLIGNPIVLPSTTNTYMKLTDGPWMTPANGVWFAEAFPLGGALTPDAHLSLNSTLKPTNKPNDTNPALTAWDVASSDPITGHVEVIPEPVTMFGVLAGIGGLFGYIRKRRK